MGITIVISIIVVLVNLIVDILYQLIDPRVRLAGRS
jgi:ABC-type dipeptide/oligopeptide/nickel transport system permease component